MSWMWTLLASILFLVLGCQQPTSGEKEVTLDTDDEKTIYAIGLATGMNLERFYVKEDEMPALMSGLRDGVTGAKPQVELMEYQAKIQTLQRARSEEAAKVEGEASKTFLEGEAAKPGAQRADSGLIYFEEKAGEGASPKATDTVVVHYTGKLRDGTVFDSSVQRGTPFRTRLNSVIPCWTEGMQKMKVGGKGRLVCPSEIAYRNLGAPPHIKPGATLMFEVELLEIAAE